MHRILFILMLFCYTCLQAQLLPFKRYSIKDGLDSKIVYSVIRDKRDLLWISTPFGISWFDGNHFYQPEVPRKVDQLYVQRFYQDKEGTTWALTFYNGFYKFQDGRFTQYLVDPLYHVGNKNNIFDLLEISRGYYIVATDQGIYTFDGISFNRIDPTHLIGQVSSLALTPDGTLLAGYYNGVYCYKFEKQWKLTNILLPGISVEKVVTQQEHSWVATEKGLYLFDQPLTDNQQKPREVYLRNSLVQEVSIDRKNQVWCSANGITYRLQDHNAIAYNANTGLNAPSTQIYFDKENIMWVCTREGLFKLTDEYYTFEKMDGQWPSTFARVNNKVYIGVSDGMEDVETKQRIRFHGEDQVITTSLFFTPSTQEVWAATTKGTYLLRDNKVDKHFGYIVTSVLDDGKDGLWISTTDDSLFLRKAGSSYPVHYTSFPDDFISTIYKDDRNYLWLGFRTGGVIKYKIEGLNLTPVNEYSVRNGFGDLKTRSCHPDGKGNILIGTRSNGLYIFSTTSNHYWHFNERNGLKAPWIMSMDGDSIIYLGTNNGLVALQPAKEYNKAVFYTIPFANEEISTEITSILVNHTDVWLNANGLLHFIPTKYQKDTLPPRVFITKVSIGAKPDTTLEPYQQQYKTPKLRYNNNVIAFEFTGVHLKDEEPLQYRYKLEGQDRYWNASTERNFVSYNLPPGNYRFVVEARNSAGIWSQQPAVYSFSISPAFWSEWWFIGLLITAGLVLGYIIYRYRLQQAIRVERLRHKISSDLHDDIGSTLSSISILSEIILKEGNHTDNKQMVAEIKESSLDLMEKMDDIVWSINPTNDSLENLLLRIKRFASRIFEAKNIEYTIDIHESISSVKLDMEHRQHLYLILKEAINNLVKYSGATKAAIEVEFKQQVLKIRISDNGIGFDPYKKETGNGMLTMRSRARVMNAKFHIESAEREGTTLRLEVKIK